MVSRICTGPVPDAAQAGKSGGKKAEPSQNNREIARYISSEDQMMRVAALDRVCSPKALAYLAATADHKDVKEAAKQRLFMDHDSLFKILDELSGRPPVPWEKELVRIVEEETAFSGTARITKLKAWQLNRSPAFGAFVKCNGEDGSTLEYMDESPAQFSLETLAQIMDAAQA